MSYGATADGWLTLRFDTASKAGLRVQLSAWYDRLCQVEQEQAADFRKAIRQQYQRKKEALTRAELDKWFRQEFSDIGYHDVFTREDPAQQTFYIEMSFDGKYQEESITGLLDALSPYTVEGEFAYCGEDGAHWRLLFSGARWVEQSGEITYTDLAAPKKSAPFPALVEDADTFTALLSEVEARLKSDNRPAQQRGRQLMAAFQDNDPNGVLLALTGWSLQSLGALAGIWKKEET